MYYFKPLIVAVVLTIGFLSCKTETEKKAPIIAVTSVHASERPSPQRRAEAGKPTPYAKYVFLLIGDGMGANQAKLAARYRQNVMVENNSAQNDLTGLPFMRFPVQTTVTTFSNNSEVTDSAAAGTALATGHKTNNGVISKSPDLQTEFESVAAKAQRSGYRVGIVTSVSVNHATPAAFYAHRNSRNMYYGIAMSVGPAGYAFFGGGGFNQARGENGSLPDAYQSAVSHGYHLIHTPDAFASLDHQTTRLFAMHPVLMADGAMPWAIEPDYVLWPLSDIAARAANYLFNEKGFFMMVEGGKIDWACHENDGATLLHEVLAFSDTVEAAMAFYRKHPQDTLIVVTADHETGGLMQRNGASIDAVNVSLLQHQRLALATLNARIAEAIDKGMQFRAVLALIEENTGLGDSKKGLALTAAERLQLKAAFAQMTQGSAAMAAISAMGNDKKLQRQREIGAVAIDILNRKAGLEWGTFNHTGVDVPLYALGAGQSLFDKKLDNTDIPKLMREAMGF